MAPLILPNLINFLEEAITKFLLRIRSEQGVEALKLLDSNEIDFAIGRFEMVSSRFGSIELYTEKYVLHDEFKA